MKLTELNNNRRTYSTRVLQEQYEMPFNVEKMSMSSTRTMLAKVRGLMTESKQSPDYHSSQSSGSYMKLVFMEQALSDHYNELRSLPQPRIMVENEEVEKSQVVLAVQKMLEDVGQMQVKELPALVSSIESEIGVNESQTYNDEVSGQLDTLSASLKETSSALKNALNGLTGQAVDAAFDAGAEVGMDTDMDDTDLSMGDEEPTMSAEIPPIEEPEFPPTGGVGRAKR